MICPIISDHEDVVDRMKNLCGFSVRNGGVCSISTIAKELIGIRENILEIKEYL